MKALALLAGRITALVLVALLIFTACQQQASTPRAFGGALTLVPSAARTTAFTSTPLEIGGARGLLIQLDITAVSGTTPTLDVKVQTSVDGTNFCDIAGFAQRTTGAARQLLRIAAVVGTPQAEAACTDGTIAAGTVHQGPLGRSIRIKHAAPGGSATPTYTYSVTAWAVD